MPNCDNDPPIEKMIDDLLQGGWSKSHGGTVWTTLWGTSYRGPHKAWHIWHGGIEEWIAIGRRHS
jgi:hypothetical protein